MTEQPFVKPPEGAGDDWETTVQETARHFAYPLTPDITGRLRQQPGQRRQVAGRIWRVAAAAVLALIVVTVTVPEVRAFVLEMIRIGAVRIFLIEPTATTTTSTARPTQTPFPTPVLLNSVLELPGETTLAAAQAVMNNRIHLPTYPADLGAPERVYIQQLNAPLVTLVWMVPGKPEQVRLSLEVLDNNLIANKLYPYEGVRQEVQINGRRAEWLTDAHEVWYFGGDREFRRVVRTPVLIWQAAAGVLTYRLETDLSLEEAIKVAESMGGA
jgi:hypothetical protein